MRSIYMIVAATPSGEFYLVSKSREAWHVSTPSVVDPLRLHFFLSSVLKAPQLPIAALAMG